MLRKRLAAASAALCLLLGSCEWTQVSVDTLLTPPALIAEQQQIDQALKKEVGTGQTVNLVYPKTGDLRSAYLFCNLDKEPTDEALVLYRLTDTNGATGALKLTVLDRGAEGWNAVWTSQELPANEVEKIVEMDQNGERLLLLGITLFSSDSGNNQQVLVYRYRENGLQELMTQECAAHAVADLNDDGMMELFTIEKNVVAENEEATTTATRFHWEQGTFVPNEQLLLDPQVNAYTLTAGKTAEGTPALFVDGVRGKQQVTELLQLREDKLVNPLQMNKTTRTVGLNAMDFDRDGSIEIPRQNKTPSGEKRVSWYSVTEEGPVFKQDTYTDFASGYVFRWPEQFQNDVVIQRSPDGTNVIMSEAESPEKMVLTLSVRASSTKAVERQTAHAFELARDGQLVYTATIGSDGAYTLTEEEIREAFALL